jgi:hypothetical protein
MVLKRNCSPQMAKPAWVPNIAWRRLSKLQKDLLSLHWAAGLAIHRSIAQKKKKETWD